MAAAPKSELNTPAAPATATATAKVADAGVEDELRKVFSLYDKNEDGKISASELRDLVARLGRTGGAAAASANEVALMMEELDIDGNGFVDFQEFTEFFARNGGCGGKKEGDGNEDEERQLRDAFEVYDLDGNGRISAGELHSVMKNLGETCSVADCSRMIRSVDADGDGCVNFQEFKKMMTSGGLAKGSRDANSGKGVSGNGAKKKKKRWF